MLQAAKIAVDALCNSPSLPVLCETVPICQVLPPYLFSANLVIIIQSV